MCECCGLNGRVLLRVLADLGLLLLVSVPDVAIYYYGEPFKRGFFCNDESLRYPYRDSTVPDWLLYVFGFGLPLTTIIVTESVVRRFFPDHRLMKSNCVLEWYKHTVVFFFGAGCTKLITDIGKHTIGRLRPHFFQLCSPMIDCSDPKLRNAYLENFRCREKDEYLLKDMRLSFPSGHSSFSAYCMTFLVMYVGAKLSWSGSRRIKHVVQFFAIVLTFYTGMSRVSDYKHHWSDVLAGFAIGFLTAILTVLFVSDLYSRKNRVSRWTAETPTAENIALGEDVASKQRKYTVI